MNDQPTRSAALGATLALHALALSALLSHKPVREALADSIVMVAFIAPQHPEPRSEPRAELQPPRPVAQRAPRRETTPTPILAVPETTSSISASVPPISAPVLPVTPAPMTATATPESAAVPITPPVFDADYLENPSPPYPALSRRLGEHGRVVLRVRVDAAGRAEQVQVQVSSGHARLDEAARETVRRWRFIAARRGPEPVAAWVLIPISFEFES